MLRSETVILSCMLESTPTKKLASLSHFCTMEFISLMIWPLFTFISAVSFWTGVSLLAIWGEKDGPVASQWDWMRVATLLGKQVSLPERLFLVLAFIVLAFILSAFIPAFPPCKDILFTGIVTKEWWGIALLANKLSLTPSFYNSQKLDFKFH